MTPDHDPMHPYFLYKRMRTEEGRTPTDCRDALNLSANSVSKYERRLRDDLSTEDYLKVATPHALRAQRAWDQPKANVKIKSDPLPDLPPQSLGVLAEDFIYYQLRAHGYEVYRPSYPISGTDLLVVQGRQATRIEVKSTVDRDTILLGRAENRSGSRVAYADGLVDFYICLQLRTKLTLVIPSAAVKTGSLSLSPHGDYWGYRDAYHLIGALAQLGERLDGIE